MVINLFLTYANLAPIDIYKNLECRAKNTTILDCWFLDVDGLSVDITGATVFFTVKDKPSDLDSAAKISKTITTLTNSSAGEVEIEITPAESEDLLGNYIYDIKIKTSDGKIYTSAEGNICFKKSLTIRES